MTDDREKDEARAEPSSLLKASPYLMRLLTNGGFAIQELERQARGAQRLKEAFSSIPFYARQAENDPDYWHEFYASRINW